MNKKEYTNKDLANICKKVCGIVAQMPMHTCDSIKIQGKIQSEFIDYKQSKELADMLLNSTNK